MLFPLHARAAVARTATAPPPLVCANQANARTSGDVLGEGGIPEAGRSPALLVVMELVGIAALVFLVRRLDLAGEGRELFRSKGQILREKMADDA